MVFVLSICQSRNETGQGFFLIFITRTLMFWKDIFLGSLCLLVKNERSRLKRLAKYLKCLGYCSLILSTTI